MAGMSASDSKSSRYSISVASSAAPSGVRKTAAIPAAIPATSRIRFSRRVAGSHRPTSAPTAPPICMVGPSRPPDPPEPSVNRAVTAFTKMTRRRTRAALRSATGPRNRFAGPAFRGARKRPSRSAPSVSVLSLAMSRSSSRSEAFPVMLRRACPSRLERVPRYPNPVAGSTGARDSLAPQGCRARSRPPQPGRPCLPHSPFARKTVATVRPRSARSRAATAASDAERRCSR